MKTTVLYDDQCPLCAAYTQGFVKMGLLPEEGRLPFSQANPHWPVDWQRGRAEIPLIAESGQVLYGVDALTYILSQRWPFINKIVHIRPVRWFFLKLYKLISYNRRHIVASSGAACSQDCTPDYNLRYHLLLTGFCVLFASLITWWFGASVQEVIPAHSPTINGFRMLLIAGTGWVLQGLLAILFLRGRKSVIYGVHLGVLMLIGVLILVPFSTLVSLVSADSGFLWQLLGGISVAASSGVMLWQHIMRARVAGIPQVWTVLWLLNLQLTAAAWIIYFLSL